MQTLQQNEKYYSAENTIKGNISPTLLPLCNPTKTKLSQAHTQDKFSVDGKSVLQVFLKEVIALIGQILALYGSTAKRDPLPQKDALCPLRGTQP